MAILFNLILFALVAYAIYDIYLLRRRIYIYKKILKRSKKFEFISDDITKTILVFGAIVLHMVLVPRIQRILSQVGFSKRTSNIFRES
jgi:hypothetical protein